MLPGKRLFLLLLLSSVLLMRKVRRTATRDPAISVNVIIIAAIMERRIAISARPQLGRTPRILAAGPLFCPARLSASYPMARNNP